MKWSYGPVGVKDLFTLLNLTSGVFALYFALHGRLDWAGYAIILGYVFGDTLDGAVARATKTGNRFGGELDAITDHFVHVFVPAIIFVIAYERGGHPYLGLTLGGLLIATATIRHALFAVEKFNFSLCWCGLPRTISGFVALSFPNSTLFFRENPHRYIAGAVVVVVLSALNLVPIPYMTHRGRKFQWYVLPFIAAFFIMPFVLYFLHRDFVFDFFFAWMFGFAAGGWIPLLPDERRAFYTEYKRWAHEVASKK
jgi:phosphatidylserine synthase